MKISRTSIPPKPATAGKAPGVVETSGKAFASKLAGAKAESAHAANPAKPTRSATAIAVSDIGAELKAGKLTPKKALDKVIERIVDKQVGVKASPTVRQQISTALRESLVDDPLLAAKVRALASE
jgi:hypothetical protein